MPNSIVLYYYHTTTTSFQALAGPFLSSYMIKVKQLN